VTSVVTGLVSSVIAVANKILWNHFEVRNTHIYLSLEICLFELEEGMVSLFFPYRVVLQFSVFSFHFFHFFHFFSFLFYFHFSFFSFFHFFIFSFFLSFFFSFLFFFFFFGLTLSSRFVECLFLEKEEWLNLGKKLITLSDPNLALTTRQWSICSIANICLIISETDSTALIWWRLFFYRYFAFIASGTGSSSGML
jgi:hypothetical protein